MCKRVFEQVNALLKTRRVRLKTDGDLFNVLYGARLCTPVKRGPRKQKKKDSQGA